MKRHLIAAASLIAVLGLSTGAAAQSESIAFTLENATPYTLVSLYISDPGTDSWEEDILGVDMVGPGEAADVLIDDGLSGCEYDIRADFSDGENIDLRGVDLCALNGSVLTVSQ